MAETTHTEHSNEDSSDESPFSNDTQNAIFNFLFVLVAEYSVTMDSVSAINKACDWIISLGQTVKKQANEFDSEVKETYNLFTQN